MAALFRFVTTRWTMTSPLKSWPSNNGLARSCPFSTSVPHMLNAHPDTKRTPPYPHGFSRIYKQSNRGLYGHIKVRTNARVSDNFPAQRTIRRWHPNVHRKRLYSACLGRYIRVKLVIRVLRTIDKVGGIDSYLLGQSPGRVRELGPTGWALRWRLLRTEKGKQVWEEERRKLGLTDIGPRDEGWMDPIEVEREKPQHNMLHGMTEDGEIGETPSEDELAARERLIDEELDRDDQLGDAGGLDIGKPGKSHMEHSN